MAFSLFGGSNVRRRRSLKVKSRKVKGGVKKSLRNNNQGVKRRVKSRRVRRRWRR